MDFVVAFFLRPYAFWLAAGIATIIYGGLTWLILFLWHDGYRWPAGAIGLLVGLSALKYVRILNQEIASAESFECEGLLWVMRIPGVSGRALYSLSHLGAGGLVFFGIAIPTHLLGVPDRATIPVAAAFGIWAISYRLRHHPLARQFTFTGLKRESDPV